MDIFILRHGETDWNSKRLFQGHTDIPLNKKGKSQAIRIARALKGRKIDIIISSDLKRAFQTAQAVKTTLKCKGAIIKDKSFRERHYGSLEGKVYVPFQNDKKGFDGEKDKQFFSRINRAFKKSIKTHKGKNIVIVAHGGVVRAIVAAIIQPADYKKLRVYNASISEIYYDEKREAFFLVLFNSVAHLSKADRLIVQTHIKGV